ncbi:hypothetical protein HOT32_gp26 [Erwinia phage Faunus]|uniref:Uncharacterized protein n=1 Tax=Erwinia phage Faunus TaxID=2182346 RepID=A0A2U8UWH9_9CAUD|nr:hypothetical protein HOT32_gp26 [Erwinia phage Faunus]AWN08609.1 hypothetical protein [Erwinia phage Faunus]
MPRKTLKQKLKSQIRLAKEVADIEHEKAGFTINYELQLMQSVGMAHGVMASLLEAKKHFDVESEQYKAFEKVSQGRIAQCMQQLINMGVSHEEANRRITQGH